MYLRNRLAFAIRKVLVDERQAESAESMDGDVRQRSSLGRPHAYLARLEADARSAGQDARYSHRLDRGNWDLTHETVIAERFPRWLGRHLVWTPGARTESRMRAAFVEGWTENE